MPTINKYVSSFLLVCYIFILGCKKEKEEPTTEGDMYSVLSETEVKSTPYFFNAKFDTIRFLTDANDTLMFVKANIDTTWYIKTANNGRKAYFQNLAVKYISTKNEPDFIIKISFMDLRNGWEDYMFYQFTFMNASIYYYIYDIGSAGMSNYAEVITFNGRDFYKSNYTNPEFKPALGKVYLNKEFGLFRFEDTQNNKIYTLLSP